LRGESGAVLRVEVGVEESRELFAVLSIPRRASIPDLRDGRIGIRRKVCGSLEASLQRVEEREALEQARDENLTRLGNLLLKCGALKVRLGALALLLSALEI
jgi:hypothetical protein